MKKDFKRKLIIIKERNKQLESSLDYLEYCIDNNIDGLALDYVRHSMKVLNKNNILFLRSLNK